MSTRLSRLIAKIRSWRWHIKPDNDEDWSWQDEYQSPWDMF